MKGSATQDGLFKHQDGKQKQCPACLEQKFVKTFRKKQVPTNAAGGWQNTDAHGSMDMGAFLACLVERNGFWDVFARLSLKGEPS